MKKILILLLFVLSAFTASAQFNIIGTNQVNVSSELRVRDTTIVNLILKWAGDAASVDALLDSIEAHRTDIDANTTALSAKQNTITGAASTITSSNLTANRALLSDGSGKVAVSANIDNVEIDRLDGLSDNIMTLLNAKQNTLSGATSDVTTTNLTASRIMVTNGTGKIAVDPNVNTLHVGYLAGLTSSVQDQLNTKLESVDISDINATGTPDASTVLYGNGTWASPGGGVTGSQLSDSIQFVLDSLQRMTGGVVDTTFEIGVWDMNISVDGTGEIDVTIPTPYVTSWNQVRTVTVWIRNDNDNTGYPLEKVDGTGVASGGVLYVTGTGTVFIRLAVLSSGFFDNGNFDTDTSFNRGWITIEYEP